MKMIRRSVPERLELLRRHLLIIENSLRTAVTRREEAFLDSMAGSVHTLIGQRQKHPLLYELARECNHPLIVYGMPLDVFERMLDEEQEILGATSIKWCGDSARPDVGEPFYKSELCLKAWMESTHLIISGHKWSGEKLLEQLRNKDAAHVDPEIPEDMAILRQFKLLGWSSQYQAIVPMGIAVLALGQRFLKSIADEKFNK